MDTGSGRGASAVAVAAPAYSDAEAEFYSRLVLGNLTQREVSDLIDRNAEHLDAMKSATFNASWLPMLKDYRNLLALSLVEQANGQRRSMLERSAAWRKVSGINPYILSMMLVFIGLSLVTIDVYLMYGLNEWLGSAWYTSILTMVLISVPVGALVEFFRRRAERAG